MAPGAVSKIAVNNRCAVEAPRICPSGSFRRPLKRASPTLNHPTASEFQDFFPSQVSALAAADLNDIDMDVPDVFNSGQSQASGSNESRYLVQFGNGDSSLRLAFNRLSPRSTALSPPMRSSCVLRLWSCAGCHRLNNGVAVGGLVWSKSLGFTHVSEQATEVVDGVTRFVISPTLLNAFLKTPSSLKAEAAKCG